MYLSVIIPAYNEEKRIGDSLQKIHDFMESRDHEYEVIVINDGSDDGTSREAEKSALYAKNKLKILENKENRGKGFSVKRGVLSSLGGCVLLTDADLSTPINEVDKLFDCLGRGNDIAIGSRARPSSRVSVAQPWYRQMMGRVFNLIIRTSLMGDFKDTQCGFKLFKGDVVRDIAPEMKIDGFSFDVELLYLARKRGYKIEEVGVSWDNSPHSTVRIFSSSVKMFLDLLKIKRLHG